MGCVSCSLFYRPCEELDLSRVGLVGHHYTANTVYDSESEENPDSMPNFSI